MDFSPVVHFVRCVVELSELAAPIFLWLLTPIWIVAFLIAVKNALQRDGDVGLDVTALILFFAMSVFGIYNIYASF